MSTSNVMPWRIVIAACIGMFAATATVPAIANLFGITATVWGISSYVVGHLSDRIGRRAFLLFSPVLLAAAMFCAAHAPNYWILIAIIVVAAMCCGSFTSAALAEVSLQTPDSHQGRALGYVMSGQSLTLLIGIPLSAWLGAKIGWRGTHSALAVLALFSAMSVFIALYVSSSKKMFATPVNKTKTSLREALSGPITRLFLALISERVCFGLATFYYASYLRTTYNLPINAVAIPLALFAVGNIAGTFAGGQLADRMPYRRISFGVSLGIAGCIALPWFLWQQSVTVTVALGVLFAFFNALSRPSLLAALADVPTNIRGVILGLNSSFASVGWLTAALVGGWLYSSVGFGGFGPLMTIMCFAAALVVVPDSRMRTRRA